MKITEADVVWTPGEPEAVRVERHGSGWTRTPGDLWMPAAKAFEYNPPDPEPKLEFKDGKWWTPRLRTQLLSLFVLFNTLVVRDRIDPLAAHKAFLAIDEYRQTISRDQAGAEE
jgi:hypothetical protein